MNGHIVSSHDFNVSLHAKIKLLYLHMNFYSM